MHDVAGISNEALGVWFRFREMMGLVRVQFKGARLVSACVRACRRTRGHEPGLVWTVEGGCLGAHVGCWQLLALASSGSGLEPQKPNQTIDLISQIGGPPGQIRPFLSSINHLRGLIR